MSISGTQKPFKHLDTVTVFFIAILLISNVVSSKITQLGAFTFDAGTLIFPLSYIFGDILTEVYGYNRTRKVIWLGFIANFVMAAVFILVGMLPASPEWNGQGAYETILGLTPQIVLASMLAYFCGEFTNSFILAKLKLATKGKYLWSRTIGSTVFGQLIDTVIFVTIAFWGIFPHDVLITIIVSNYIFKTLIEIGFTPITYKIVSFLKKTESEDYYDKKTNFNPFVLSK